VAFGWVLLIAVIADWGFEHERLADETPLLIGAVIEAGSGRDLAIALDAQNLFKERAGPGASEVIVPLRDFPRLLDAVARRVDGALPRRGYQFAGAQLPLAYFRLAVMSAPPLILAVALFRLRRVRRLRRLLVPGARPMGETQQILNSPFYERITSTAGESRARHTSGVLIALAPILVAAIVYVPAVMNYQRQNFAVVVHESGQVRPVDDSAFVLHSVRDAHTFAWAGVLALTVAGWIAVAVRATGGLEAPVEEKARADV
jgi:hypothetical protein